MLHVQVIISAGFQKERNAVWKRCLLSRHRRIHSIFLTSDYWKKYDIFAHQKIDGFRNSRIGVLELAARYKDLVQQIRSAGLGDEEKEKILFAEMFDICLWGNATDLSLLTTLTRDDIERLQGAKARKAAEANILVNHTPATFELLRDLKAAGGERRVDFVLDNAGFELFADLILAGYLLASGLATTIVLHPKSIPWFVSDVMPADFAALLQAMASPRPFFEKSASGTAEQPLTDKEAEDVAFLFQEWATFHAEGQLVIRPNRYWTAGGSFWRLPYEAKELYEDLKESKLVIFKGDLNYRKLTADASPPYQQTWKRMRVQSTNDRLGYRLPGILRHPSLRPSARWVPNRASTSSHSGHARAM